ncbi:hypothetical protein V1477_006337 [Vespula maculifrons]|uniref:Uncharacterized protein n=1 Tax=Vespula maculifrons TaxID=7453 RepID=A0ABD2CK51_VESMC
MVVEGATSPLNDPGPVLLGAIVSEKKIFPLNSYYSAPIGPIWTKKIWAQRARGVLSNDQGSVLLVPFKPLLLGSYWFDQDEKNMGVEGATSPLNDPGLVLLGAIVSEKKILKEKCFFPCSL